MAGPRAPIGTLSQHSENAAKLAGKNSPSVSRNAHSKSQGKSRFATSKVTDSSSPSSSSSDNDSDSDASGANVSNEKSGDFLAKLRASKNPNGNTSSQLKAHKSPTAKKAGKKSSSDSESETSSDSSSSSDSGSGTANKAAKSSSESSSESDSDSNTELKTKAKAKNTKQASIEESESDSESSNSSESDSGAKVTKKAHTIIKVSESESESESEGESQEGAAKIKPKAAKNTKPDKEAAQSKVPSSQTALVKAKSTEMVISSAESSGSESGDDSDEDAGQPQALEKQNGKAPIPETLEFLGPNFQLRKATNSADAAEVARIFRDAKAEGKQIWYFTMPASLPIEVVQEQTIQLDRLRDGKTLVSHAGFDYTGASEEVVDTSIKVLIPNKTGNSYETLNRPVDRTIYIKKIMRFSQDDHEPTMSMTQNVPRPQPKGLKARYQPFGVPPTPMGKVGVDASSKSDEDVEMAPVPSLLPRSEMPRTEGKKRKHGAEEGTSSTSAKKPKKARVDASTSKETPIAPPSVPSLNGGALKKGKNQTASSPVLSRSAPAPPSDRLPSTQPTLSSKSNGTRAAPAKVTPVMPPSIPGLKSGSKNS